MEETLRTVSGVPGSHFPVIGGILTERGQLLATSRQPMDVTDCGMASYPDTVVELNAADL